VGPNKHAFLNAISSDPRSKNYMQYVRFVPIVLVRRLMTFTLMKLSAAYRGAGDLRPRYSAKARRAGLR
jgi:hypothetical protein